MGLAAEAQTRQGQSFWTGSLGITLNETQGVTDRTAFGQYSTRFSLNRTAFFRDNWAVSGQVGLDYRNNWQQTPGSPDSRTQHLDPGLSAALRHYLGRDSWRVFLGAGLSATGQFSRQPADGRLPNGQTYRIDQRRTTLSVTPFTELGGVYFFAPRWGIEAISRVNSFPFQLAGLETGLLYRTGSRDSETGTHNATGAQLQRGNWVVSGTLATSRNALKNEANNLSPETQSAQQRFSLQPAVGRFVRNGTLVGLALGVSSTRETISVSQRNVGAQQVTTWEAGPFVRRYLGSGQLRPFAGASVSFQYLVYRFRGQPEEDFQFGYENRTVSVGGSAGLAYLIGTRFLAEATLADLSLQRNVFRPEISRGWAGQAAFDLRPRLTLAYVFL